MSQLFVNYGLDCISKSEEARTLLIQHGMANGTFLPGYSGMPYLYFSAGAVDFYAYTKKEEDGSLVFSDLHIHGGGPIARTMRYTGTDITPKGTSGLSRTLMLQKEGGPEGALPVEIVTADVLPDLVAGDFVTLQLAAQPVKIEYYADEEEYRKAHREGQPSCPGTFKPARNLHNRAQEEENAGQEYNLDALIEFHATVTAIGSGKFTVNGDTSDSFIRFNAATEYGELEFNHAMEQVPESMRENMREGAVVSGVCVLSGDAAINEYKNGLIRDREHNLRELRYVFAGGSADRLREILSPMCLYRSDSSKLIYLGNQGILDRMNYVNATITDGHDAYPAVVTASQSDAIPIGTPCVALTRGPENAFVSVAFITVDEEGYIETIHTSTDSRFRFRVLEGPYAGLETSLPGSAKPEPPANTGKKSKPGILKKIIHKIIKER